MAEDQSIWEIILPYDYVSSSLDMGLYLAHPNKMKPSFVPHPSEITLSSFINLQKEKDYLFVMNELKFINEFGKKKSSLFRKKWMLLRLLLDGLI
ncbi:hypothetical protein [Paenisporosarcina sp. NPDC076898]|uniref:hypothetical protein n=1 Tax=unclassified Paenisporosarcina TaxID=2642018 RepID=UPI003D05D53E